MCLLWLLLHASVTNVHVNMQVIRMRRGHEDEGPEGLFAIKSSSNANGSSSHTVAFEDRGDATNFCYLLESFFDDLGDFSAEIVPFPVKVRILSLSEYLYVISMYCILFQLHFEDLINFLITTTLLPFQGLLVLLKVH